MAQGVLIAAIDLGTATTTARFIRACDQYDAAGKIHRQSIGDRSGIEMKDWPGGRRGDAIGKACVPTDLVYDRATGKLLFWGFEAHRYLGEIDPEIGPERVFVVNHIKLLLPDPARAKSSSSTTTRYRNKRDELIRVLRKQPFDVFQDFMDVVVFEVVNSAMRNYGKFDSHQVELSLAFPSGWPEYIHREVAAIGARAMEKAIVTHRLVNMSFGIQNVYTVSETLCGVKEWLEIKSENEAGSIVIGNVAANIDELNVGDCFLPVDIGGGTGCMTPLKLVSKKPLQVDQIDRTQSLEVSGEAVEAEFERLLRSMHIEEDYGGDIERLINRICHDFKEEKKVCSPSLGNSTWNFGAAQLRANPSKGIHETSIKFDRKLLEACFDPVIDTLEDAIKATLKRRPEIKAIVFLGQFGGSCACLKQRMAESPIANDVIIRHSQSGKMDVVKGALSERQRLTENFVRKSETVKSYGSLITLPWGRGLEGTTRFPNAIADGAVDVEKEPDGLRLKVIEWAIPKGTGLEKNEKCDVGTDGRKCHIWKFNEKEIDFEDVIIVSDEVPPVLKDGKSFTLWTKAHDENQLFIDGERIDVQQISFSWDLSMSEKLSPTGDFLGAYSLKDLEDFYVHPQRRKGPKGRQHFRSLDYDLVWHITEMQVKAHVRAIFPRAVGPPTMQLAKQRAITAGEKCIGESRSVGLERDITITAGITPASAGSNSQPEPRSNAADVLRRSREEDSLDMDDDFLGSRDLVEELARLHPHQRAQGIRTSGRNSLAGTSTPSMTGDNVATNSWRMVQPLSPSSGAGNQIQDGRRREGCYTCKVRKIKCDLDYTFDEITRSWTCAECDSKGIDCFMDTPDWAEDPVMVKIRTDERRKRILLGKRKSKDIVRESNGSGARGRSGDRLDRERSTTFGGDNDITGLGRGSAIGLAKPRRVLGKGKAIRGGLSGRF